MRLHHLHLPGPITYKHSLRLQEVLLEKHFAHKTLIRSTRDASKGLPDAPNPTLLTFQTYPTYTVGRRHLNANPLSEAQISFLTSNSSSPQIQRKSENESQLAEFYPSPRGGLLTYHAPGQLTAYLVLNLRTHDLTPRCYIRLVENTIIRTIARFGVKGGITEDPGVWVLKPQDGDDQRLQPTEQTELCEVEQRISKTQDQGERPVGQWVPTDRKICAIGVQVSRGITSHGIGLNLFDSPILTHANLPARDLYRSPVASNAAEAEQVETFTRPSTQLDHYQSPSDGSAKSYGIDHSALAPGYLSWGFSRIVACGLEGKSVTWVSQEQEHFNAHSGEQDTQSPFPSIESVARTLAVEVSNSLDLDEHEISNINEQDVLD